MKSDIWRAFRVLAMQVAVLLVFAAVGEASAAAAERLSEEDMKYAREAADGVNAFAFDMYRELARTEKGNIFFGPYTISAALAMAYAGAEGAPAQEAARVLHFGPNIHRGMGALSRHFESGNNSDNACRVWTANTAWPVKSPDLKLTETFANIIERDYRSEIVTLDYERAPEESRRTINDWVESKTNKRIKDLIPQGGVDKSTSMVLTSASYFFGKWAQPFKLEPGQPQGPLCFHYTDDKGKPAKKAVDFLASEQHVFYEESEGAQMIAVPYEGGRYLMIFVLPTTSASFAEYEQSLGQGKSGEQFKRVISGDKQEVIIAVPKFGIERQYSLFKYMNNLTENLASRLVFNNTLIHRTTGEPFPLVINDIYHKAFIQVDEYKTEAAAATAVEMRPFGAIKTPLIFLANRPFLYVLVERETGVIMFMGRYMLPES